MVLKINRRYLEHDVEKTILIYHVVYIYITMDSVNSIDSDEAFRKICVHVFSDHRTQSTYREFLIDPKFNEELVNMLSELSLRKDTNEDENGDPIFMCESGFEGCDHDDFESMSDECKQERAEAHAELYNDTYS